MPLVDRLYLDFLPSSDAALVAAAELDYDAEPTLRRATPLVRAGWFAALSTRERLIRGAGGGPLDVVWVGGAGLGVLARRLSGSIGVSVVVDTSDVQLRRTPEGIGRERVLARALAEALPVRDGWADVIEFQGVLDHVVDPVIALAHGVRASKPGGLLIAVMTNDGSWYRGVARRIGRRGYEQRDTHHRRYSADDLAELFREEGLQRVATCSVMFLRAPRVIDLAIGRLLGERGTRRLVLAVDWLGRHLLGAVGGGIAIAWGYRPLA